MMQLVALKKLHSPQRGIQVETLWPPDKNVWEGSWHQEKLEGMSSKSPLNSERLCFLVFSLATTSGLPLD